MAARRTRVILSIPWDDEDQEHPAQWGYEFMLGIDRALDDREVVVVDFQEVDEQGNPLGV